jgi:hypothetical protein
MDGTTQARSLIDSTCGVLSLSQWYRPLPENTHCTDPFDTEDREPQQDKVAIRTAALSSSQSEEPNLENGVSHPIRFNQIKG